MTQDIEKWVEELAERFCCNGLIQRMDGTHWTETELREEARQALTETRHASKKAGIDEVVELLKEKRNGHCGKKGCLQAYCINRKIIRRFCDDIIKALQDNK